MQFKRDCPKDKKITALLTRDQVSDGTSLETLPPSEVLETALRHASVGLRCEMVCSATFLRRTTKTEKPMESSRLAEFGCEISPG